MMYHRFQISIARFTFVLSVATMLILAPATGPAHATTSNAVGCAVAKQMAALREASSLLRCDRKALFAQAPHQYMTRDIDEHRVA